MNEKSDEILRLKENLRELVRERRMNFAQLARQTRVPPQTLNNWMAGAKPKDIDQVKRVANYFGISIDELCYGNLRVDIFVNVDYIKEREENRVRATFNG